MRSRSAGIADAGPPTPRTTTPPITSSTGITCIGSSRTALRRTPDTIAPYRRLLAHRSCQHCLRHSDLEFSSREVRYHARPCISRWVSWSATAFASGVVWLYAMTSVPAGPLIAPHAITSPHRDALRDCFATRLRRDAGTNGVPHSRCHRARLRIRRSATGERVPGCPPPGGSTMRIAAPADPGRAARPCSPAPSTGRRTPPPPSSTARTSTGWEGLDDHTGASRTAPSSAHTTEGPRSSTPSCAARRSTRTSS